MEKGYKTGSFWAVFAATVAAALTASGTVGDGSMLAQGLATGGAALAAAGYASWQAFSKGKDGAPGWRSSEFWFSVAAGLIGLAGASGAFPEGGTAAKVIGLAAAGLAALGYGARHSLPPVSKPPEAPAAPADTDVRTER